MSPAGLAYAEAMGQIVQSQINVMDASWQELDKARRQIGEARQRMIGVQRAADERLEAVESRWRGRSAALQRKLHGRDRNIRRLERKLEAERERRRRKHRPHRRHKAKGSNSRPADTAEVEGGSTADALIHVFETSVKAVLTPLPLPPKP